MQTLPFYMHMVRWLHIIALVIFWIFSPFPFLFTGVYQTNQHIAFLSFDDRPYLRWLEAMREEAGGALWCPRRGIAWPWRVKRYFRYCHIPDHPWAFEYFQVTLSRLFFCPFCVWYHCFVNYLKIGSTVCTLKNRLVSTIVFMNPIWCWSRRPSIS